MRAENVSDLPPDVAALVRAFAGRVEDMLLPDTLVGIYLYGALTFPDSRDQVQDVDFHVVVSRPLDDAARERIRALREDLAREFGELAGELDGYFLLRDDMQSTAPPRHQMWPLSRVPVDGAWALHCAHIHAGRVITVLGPDPRTLYAVPAWPDLRAALYGEVRFVDEHLEVAAYCVLNAVRILYSFTTWDVVVSKRRAAEWGLETLAEEQRVLIEAAMRCYRQEATAEDRQALADGVEAFVASIWQRVAMLEAAG